MGVDKGRAFEPILGYVFFFFWGGGGGIQKRICDLRSFRSWCFTGTDESLARVDSRGDLSQIGVSVFGFSQKNAPFDFFGQMPTAGHLWMVNLRVS